MGVKSTAMIGIYTITISILILSAVLSQVFFLARRRTNRIATPILKTHLEPVT